METPIVDFVEEYIQNKETRFHMPGHKGHVFFGCEPYDITEIKGADVLHHGDGIIAQSEKNAAKLFGSGATHYSTEGSTHCIKAMLAILKMENRQKRKRTYILAARNVHRSMIDACALLDLDIQFLQQESGSICTCVVSADRLENTIKNQKEKPLAIYVTTPDYLGQVTQLKELVAISKKYQIPLVVDHAHGAYRHFLKEGKHPMDYGAAMCCDSAHKTLPVLTGGAYLHIHKEFLERFEPYAAQAMSLFGSTSPSYIIMQSLDLCNAYLERAFRCQLDETIQKINAQKEELLQQGIALLPSEELKIVIDCAKKGYQGVEIAEEMRTFGMECEYADRECVVLMLTPQNEEKDYQRLKQWAAKTVMVREPKEALTQKNYMMTKAERVMTIREAVLSPSEMVDVKDAKGRICASETIACPPAIPIAVSGERITEEMQKVFEDFQIEKVSVVVE